MIVTGILTGLMISICRTSEIVFDNAALGGYAGELYEELEYKRRRIIRTAALIIVAISVVFTGYIMILRILQLS